MEAAQTSINCRIRLNRLTRTRQLQQLRQPRVRTAIDEMQIALTRRRRSDLDHPSDPVIVAIENMSELLRQVIGKSPLMLAAIKRRHARIVITSPRMTQAAATDRLIRMAARLMAARERSLIQQGNQRLDRDFGYRIVAPSLRTRENDARQPQLTADQRLWLKCDRYQQVALVHPKVNVLDRSVEHIQPDAPDLSTRK
jgi:hypothetical protein